MAIDMMAAFVLLCLASTASAGTADPNDDKFAYQPAPNRPGNIVNGPSARGIAGDVPLAFTKYSSAVSPPLVGPYVSVQAAIVNDSVYPAVAQTVLYQGRTTDKATGLPLFFWYIITDCSDDGIAKSQGVNYAEKLQYSLVTPNATREGRFDNNLGMVVESGWVDFSPNHTLVPGTAPNFFPPTTAHPGSMGMDGYSPLVNIGGVVYNAPIVAGNISASQLRKWCNGIPAADMTYARSILHDKVTFICPGQDVTETENQYLAAGTVGITMTQGWSWGRPVLYISTEASEPTVATIERATYAPAFGNLAMNGDDVFASGIEDLFTIINGFTNGDINPSKLSMNNTKESHHPQRQGLNSALRGDGDPLNLLGGIPVISTDYSPAWDVTIVRWTNYAVANNYRARIIDQITAMGMLARGFMVEVDIEAIVNCPVFKRFL